MQDTQEIQWHLEPPCSMILISGAPDSLQHTLIFEGQLMRRIKVDDEKLMAVLKFCYLGWHALFLDNF